MQLIDRRLEKGQQMKTKKKEEETEEEKTTIRIYHKSYMHITLKGRIFITL